MTLDTPALARRHGIRARSIEVLGQRPGHMVVRVGADEGDYVVKASTTPGSIKMDAVNATRLAAAGLPTPEVIAHGEEPVSYAILRWIEGEPLTRASSPQIQAEVGALLRRIHDIGGGPPFEKDDTWDDWMNGWLGVALPWWQEQEGVEPEWVETAWRAYEDLRPLLLTRGHHFMLFDGRPDHFLVDAHRVVGLIDVHDAKDGDGAMDLGVMGVLDEGLLENVLIGYQADASELEALEVLIPFYIFLRRVAAAEWHGRFGPRDVAERALALANAHPLGQ